MKKLLVLLVSLSLFACKQTEIKSVVEKPDNVGYALEKKLILHDSLNLASVQIIVRSNSSSLMESYSEETLRIELVNKLVEQNLVEGRIGEDELIEQTPDVSFEIVKIDIPTTAIGFVIKETARLKATYETRVYEYYANGVRGAQVTHQDNGYPIDVKVGVLWTTSSWFYENVLEATLAYGSSCQVIVPYTFYKIRVRIIPNGDTGTAVVLWLYQM